MKRHLCSGGIKNILMDDGIKKIIEICVRVRNRARGLTHYYFVNLDVL